MTAAENSPKLAPDCSSCAALCCIVFAFDKSESFGLDKQAGEPCPHLGTNNECLIFEQRVARGFAGCVTYNCYGAGQRVTQDVFEGQSWRDDPQLTHRMGAALSVMRRIHEQLLLLHSAVELALTTSEQETLKALEKPLLSKTNWTEEELQSFEIDKAEERVASFLKALRYHFK